MKHLGFALLTLSLSSITSAANSNMLVPDVSPVAQGQYVTINVPQKRLFLFTDGKLTKAYPVATGKPSTPTNLGNHTIGPKAFNPTWHIPLSIQKELKDGRTSIPPGPNNPLGPVFVRLGNPKLGLGIHGTSAPASVPGWRSHGCIRMKSPDALEFAKTIKTGTPAPVIYQMAALNVDGNNNLWLAAYQDPYKQKNLNTDNLRKSIKAWAKAHGKNINTKRVDAILRARTGAANCLTCAKGVKLKGPLQSINWTAGSGELTKAHVVPKPAPVKDEVLPTGSAIEVDAEATKAPSKAAAKPVLPQKVTPIIPAAPAVSTHSVEDNTPASAPELPADTPTSSDDGMTNLF